MKLYSKMVVSTPDMEDQVIAACPDGVAVRSSNFVPEGLVVVIDMDEMDGLTFRSPDFQYRWFS